MKRSTSILVTLLIAAITFGALRATLGPRHHNRHWAKHENACPAEKQSDNKGETIEKQNE